MSTMSTEDDIEIFDAILEVSPVNSYSASHISTSPGQSNASPTASLRHRRSQRSESAFSSSSESTGGEEEEDDTTSDSNDKHQPPPSSNGHSSETRPSSTSSAITHQQNQTNSPQSAIPSQQAHRVQNRKGTGSVSGSGVHRATNSHQPQSEFDKALLTGVPSHSSLAVSVADQSIISTNIGGGGAPQPTSDDANSDVSGPTNTTITSAVSHPVSNSNPARRYHATKKKERKHHRVNITATTQSSSASVVSISSAASSSYPSNVTGSASHKNQIHSSLSYAANKHHHQRHAHSPKRNSTTSTNANARSSNASASASSTSNNSSDINITKPSSASGSSKSSSNNNNDGSLSGGVLPDVLMTMRQKIESMQLFDSDMMNLATSDSRHMDGMDAETRESLKRSSQQSISTPVLTSLAHKRYERRRLAAMEIEKVVRSLVQQNELERVRAILLLLSDDYVRSTSEDARKGGVVALAACAIGLKKAHDDASTVMECRDLIVASVIHSCQDFSQRVRYYATESLFNVVKVIPGLAVQHFFILFEILRSLYADVDVDVRSGAELLDKKLKEVIVVAMNSGSFSTDACVPVFARFVYMRNKATKRLTLTWLQELNEKLIGAPILEFLHLFLQGIFEMVADPSVAIRQSALAFLNSVLPKLLDVNSEAIDDENLKVDFDKILQSLVTTMEHPDPFVRKVAMYWMSRIVKAHTKELHTRGTPNRKKHQSSSTSSSSSSMMNPDGRLSPNRSKDGGGGPAKDEDGDDNDEDENVDDAETTHHFSAASISVRNSLPHVLPGILLSIGDTYIYSKEKPMKDSFLPDITTNELAEQTNACLRDAVRRDGKAYVQHLDSFIVALREELDSPGGLSNKNPPANERRLYRIDVNRDGTGIESPGWYRESNDVKERNEQAMVSSRLCALHWVIVLYESVVPDALKAEYAREFIVPIIHQLVDNPPERIVFKSLEVLAKITVKVSGEDRSRLQQSPRPSNGRSTLSGFNTPPPPWASTLEYSQDEKADDEAEFPMTDANACFALDILHPSRRKFKSRDREVFAALIQLHSYNQQLLSDLSRVIAFMCRLQPPEFVFVSFAVELDRFVRRMQKQEVVVENLKAENHLNSEKQRPFSSHLEFVSKVVQQMCHVLLNAEEAKPLRDTLRDCVGFMQCDINNPKEHRRVRLFHILLHSFSHSLVATVSLCLWGGAYRTCSMFLSRIVPLDINLMFLLELDKLVEQIERPLFRHLHVRMLEQNEDPSAEGSGAMLFKTLKFLLMIIPQSTCYNVLKDRLLSVSRFRQSTAIMSPRGSFGGLHSSNNNSVDKKRLDEQTEVFVARVLKVRGMVCDAMWHTIRSESLECQLPESLEVHEEGESRRQWLGYASKEEQQKAEERYRREKLSQQQGKGLSIEEMAGYQELGGATDEDVEVALNAKFEETEAENEEYDNPPSIGIRNKAKALRARKKQDANDGMAWKAYWAND